MRVCALLVCVCLYGYVDGGSAPFITRCHAADSPCMKSSAQVAVPVLAAGVPSLGISVLDPMYVAQVASSQAGLDMDFKNTTVKGLKNCKVLDVKRKASKTLVDLQCSVIMSGDYVLGGKLLLIPIEGNGRYKIKIRDIVVKIVYDIEPRVVGGEKYWHVASWKHSADVKTGVEFSFQNLFHGNRQLSDMIHAVANDRWKEIFQEVAPPIVSAIVRQIVEQTTKLFDAVPEKDLALT